MSAGFHEDDTIAKSYDRQLMVRLLLYLRPYKAAVAVSFLLIVAMAGLDLVGPYLTKVAIDQHIARGDARGLAGVAWTTVVVNLPGSRGGVKDGLTVLEPVLRHAVEQVHGGDHVRSE